MTSDFLCQGRQVDAVQIQWLRSWIEEHPDWSRKKLARELCLLWGWRNQREQLKDFAARSFLLKLESRGLIRLPTLQIHQRRARRKTAALLEWQEPPALNDTLKDVQPVRLEVVSPGSPSGKRWEFFLDRYHYLGFRVVGENLGYLAFDRQGRELACLLFGAAAWRCQARDRHLKWTPALRLARLCHVANNTRFLILPWVKIPHLASHVLGLAARRISQDWQAKYGHGLEWLETFVDKARYRGTCYKAANWFCLGETTGRSRQDRNHTVQVSRKAVFIYQLSR
jgi:Domain of unknown function (DUF4338)